MKDELRQEVTELQQEIDGLKYELARLTPARRRFLVSIAAALVLVWRVAGFDRFLMAVAGLLATVLVLPRVNRWLDWAVPALDKKLNG